MPHPCSFATAGRAALLLAGLALVAVAVAAELPALDACRACHGRDGISVSADIPNLAGQKAPYLARQLKAFRSGERRHDLMAAIAAQLDDAEIDALALAWSRGGAVGSLAALPSRLRLPATFPQDFRVYETVSESDREVRRYANEAAWQAAREGRALPAGALLVTATYQGERLVSLAAMGAQAGWGDEVPALLRNGDWHFALFAADGSPREMPAGQAACLACHRPLAADSHVFTMKQLRAAAQR